MSDVIIVDFPAWVKEAKTRQKQKAELLRIELKHMQQIAIATRESLHCLEALRGVGLEQKPELEAALSQLYVELAAECDEILLEYEAALNKAGPGVGRC